MFSRLATLTSLAAVVLGDGHHDTEPFFSVSLGGNMTLESVEYDSTNNLLFYQDFFAGTIYAVDYDADAIEDGTFTLDNAVAYDNNNFSLWAPTGMYSDGTYLYVLSAASSNILAFSIEDEMAVMQLEILYGGETSFLNGICNDPSDSDIIYVTAPGAGFVTTGAYTDDGALYRVNITNGTWEMVADFGNDEHPNGCAVSSDGGYVYMVSFWLDGSGNFIRFDTSDDTYTTLDGMSDQAADGLVFDDDWNLYATAWGNSTTDGRILKIMDYEDPSTSMTFEDVGTGLYNPADCSYDGDNNWLVIPEFGDPTGAIAWVDVSELDDDAAYHFSMMNMYIYVCGLLFGAYLMQ